MEQVLSNKNDKSSNGNGVLVQCIQVTYKKTPVYSLRQYFRQFGAFRNFETAYDLNPQQLEPIKRLLITYVEQEAARRVLLNESHFVENEIVNVKSTNSRQELVKENVCETERENLEIAHTREKAFNILQLPEFCIHAILERMAPGDQIRFVQSHRSFQTIFETFSRRKYKKFIWNKTQSMTMGEIRDFLSIAGKYMVELNGEIRNRYYDDVMNLLIVYCPNFEKVTLSDIYINPDSFRNFLRGLPNLRELNLTYYQLDERAFAALRDAKKLRVLKLSNMFHIRGKHLQTLTQLEHLSLHHCWLVRSKHLIKLCEALVNLRTLDIRGIHYASPCFFQVIDTHCKRLEVLKMCAPEFNYDRVALLPRLKHLEIKYPTPVDRLTIISHLAQHKADQLEVLKIYTRKCLTDKDVTSLSELRELRELSIAFNRDTVTNGALAKLCKLKQLEELTIAACDEVTDDGLLKLVKNCEKLSTLNIQYCNRITNDFVTDVASLARHRYRKLTIYTFGTAVDKKKLIQLPKYKEAAERFGLNIEFEFSKTGLSDYEYVFTLFENELLERRLIARGL